MQVRPAPFTPEMENAHVRISYQAVVVARGAERRQAVALGEPQEGRGREVVETGYPVPLRANRALLIGESVGDRTPTPRQRGSMVGFIVDPFRRRKVYYESKLEKLLLTVLIAHPDVVDVAEQQRVFYHLGGERRPHWMDAVVTWKSGRRVAYPMKYSRQIKPKLRATITAIADQLGAGFADDYRFLTEKDVHLLDAANSAKVIDCAADFDFEAQEAIKRFLGTCGPEVSLAACDAWVGDGNRGSRAAIALVQAGLLAVPVGINVGRDAVLINRFTS
jgi:hypothetical protein